VRSERTSIKPTPLENLAREGFSIGPRLSGHAGRSRAARRRMAHGRRQQAVPERYPSRPRPPIRTNCCSAIASVRAGRIALIEELAAILSAAWTERRRS
jgi:hypothetical protein